MEKKQQKVAQPGSATPGCTILVLCTHTHTHRVYDRAGICKKRETAASWRIQDCARFATPGRTLAIALEHLSRKTDYTHCEQRMHPNSVRANPHHKHRNCELLAKNIRRLFKGAFDVLVGEVTPLHTKWMVGFSSPAGCSSTMPQRRSCW